MPFSNMCWHSRSLEVTSAFGKLHHWSEPYLLWCRATHFSSSSTDTFTCVARIKIPKRLHANMEKDVLSGMVYLVRWHLNASFNFRHFRFLLCQSAQLVLLVEMSINNQNDFSFISVIIVTARHYISHSFRNAVQEQPSEAFIFSENTHQ